MTSKAALFALLAVWGVGACTVSANAQEAPLAVPAGDSGDPVSRSFTNRVWVKADTDDLPGIIRIFLSDGTLVEDSCWETHRLSPWRMTSDRAIEWNEDGTDISAELVSVSATDLTLRVEIGGTAVVQHYTAADVPYVCPDMPR